jgi:hypothetical protein
MVHARLITQEKGSLLILVVMLMSLLLFVPIAMRMTASSFKEVKQELNIVAQADNVARAGLQAALFWFKQQPSGVTADNPVTASVAAVHGYSSTYPYDDAAFAPVDAAVTVDPIRGLVKEFDLQKGLKARYEVPRQKDPGSNPIDPSAAHDVTSKRGYDPDDGRKGMAWSLESFGFVYQDKDPVSAVFNPAIDRVVSRARMSAEFVRMSLQWPGNVAGALITRTTATLSLGANCRLTGASQPGLCYYSGPVTVAAEAAKITGSPTAQQAVSGTPSTDFSAARIFSVPSERDLAFLADSVVQSPASFDSGSLSGLVFADASKTGGTLSITRLNGSGILYVNGNLTLAGGSSSLYNGVVIVTGNLDMTGPATINGAVVVRGGVALRYQTEGVELAYDAGVVNAVRGELLQYRQNKAGVRVLAGAR